jgi:3-deoxy-D-manno-octulosonate 8-phosphate phosphatase (KDO 8-P phosphatase)
MSNPPVYPGRRGFLPVEGYRALRLVVFDVDGVLTDGRLHVDGYGIESKTFDVRDGVGMALLRAAGVELAVLSGRTSAAVRHRAEELKIPKSRVVQGVGRKDEALGRLISEAGLNAREVAFVGDDIIDLPALEVAGLACCPGDAAPIVISACHVVSRAHGGRGAVRALCEHILMVRQDGSWERAIETYLSRAEG